MPTKIEVEVAIAFPAKQQVRSLQLAAGSSAWRAVELSGFIADYPELGSAYAIGVFGEVLSNPSSYQLRPGDRVEIYRPLSVKKS